MDNSSVFSMIAASNVSSGKLKIGSSDSEGNDRSGCIVFILAIIIFIVPMFINWELPDKRYTIEMKLVTNEVITETFILPNDAKFGIDNRHGAYLLVYSTHSNGVYFNLVGTGGIPVKYAVIDFKIKND